MTLESAASEDLFVLADAARYATRAELARSALLAVRRRFPRSPRSLDALFMLGRAEEARENGTRAQAIDRYDEYLAQAPTGAYAAEARTKDDSHERSGRSEPRRGPSLASICFAFRAGATRARRAPSSVLRRLVLLRRPTAFCLVIISLWAARAEAAKVVILRPGACLARGQRNTVASPRGGAVARTRGRHHRTAATANAIESRAWLERLATEWETDAVIDVVGDAAPAAVDIWVFGRQPRRSEVSRVALLTKDEYHPTTRVFFLQNERLWFFLRLGNTLSVQFKSRQLPT